MEFEWNEEQKELYEQAVSFAQKRMNKDLIEADKQGYFSRERWQELARLGVMGLLIPEEYGGAGMDALTCARVLEGLGYGCKDLGFFLSLGAHMFAVQMPVLLFGTEEQKQAYLPKLVSGEWVGAHAISEPEAGSDAMSMTTHAETDGDCYVINGRKTFVTNAPVCDFIITFATLNQRRGFAAVTAFVLEKDTPGVTIEPHTEKMGSRTSPMSDILFDNVRVPIANRLGNEYGGYKIFSKVMHWERALILAPFLGAMQRQIEDCVHYANQRVQFGKRLANYQAVTGKIVDMQVRLEAARMLIYKAAYILNHGDATMASSIAKLYTSEAAVQTFMDAMQVFGGYGFSTEFEIERHLRDALGAKIYSGTTEMQKVLISTQLGLKIN